MAMLLPVKMGKRPCCLWQAFKWPFKTEPQCSRFSYMSGPEEDVQPTIHSIRVSIMPRQFLLEYLGVRFTKGMSAVFPQISSSLKPRDQYLELLNDSEILQSRVFETSQDLGK